MNSIIKNLFAGIAVGTANIIPGVSGGTFLLILNLYERVIEAVSNLSKKSLRESLLKTIKSPNGDTINLLKNELKSCDIPFLTTIMLGAGVAIVLLSSLMEYLLDSHQTLTYSLFFGLVAASIPIPLRHIKKLTIKVVPIVVLGSLITIGLIRSVSPERSVVDKSNYYKQQYLDQSTDTTISSQYKPQEYLFVFIAGAVSVSAMILPGLSGSLILILLGQYSVILAAISGLRGDGAIEHVLLLSLFSMGMVIGLMLFVKLINWLLKHFNDPTISLLTGLIIGSLYALWPFKNSIYLQEIYQRGESGVVEVINNFAISGNKLTLPQTGEEAFIALAVATFGVIIMIPFLKKR